MILILNSWESTLACSKEVISKTSSCFIFTGFLSNNI
jgi:hypothetical protein